MEWNEMNKIDEMKWRGLMNRNKCMKTIYIHYMISISIIYICNSPSRYFCNLDIFVMKKHRGILIIKVFTCTVR